MANCATPKNQQLFNIKGFDENDLMMRVMLSQKPGHNDLIQNCDLPPPTKVISGLSDNVTVISPMNRKKIHNFVGDHHHVEDDGSAKLGLLKALRLSQTRAREAEAKYEAIIKERDALGYAFVQDSMQIFAYRQFVRLLEFQVSQFEQQKQQQQELYDCGKRKHGEEGDDGSGSNGLTLLITMAFCLGIAGVGFAIGCKYFY